MAEMSHPEAHAEGLSQATSEPAAPVNTNPVYEVGFHIVPTIAEDAVARHVDTIKKSLGDAEIVAEAAPQRMRLAYVIERSEQGKREKFAESYFGWIKFALPEEEAGARVGEIEQALRRTKEVLRYLLIATVREDLTQQKARAVYASDRLEGQTLTKAPRPAEKAGEVSEEELNKSIEALTQE